MGSVEQRVCFHGSPYPGIEAPTRFLRVAKSHRSRDADTGLAQMNDIVGDWNEPTPTSSLHAMHLVPIEWSFEISDWRNDSRSHR